MARSVAVEKQIPSLRCGMTARKAKATATARTRQEQEQDKNKTRTRTRQEQEQQKLPIQVLPLRSAAKDCNLRGF
jgi:hypothetical protein